MKRRRVAVHPSGFPWLWVYTEREELFRDAGLTQRSRDCTKCRTESDWRALGPKGWAIHPNCGLHSFAIASREAYVDALYDLAVVFPEMEQITPAPARPPTLALGNPQAGCEICGRPYAALWIAARTWRCPAHPPENSSYYRRGR